MQPITVSKYTLILIALAVGVTAWYFFLPTSSLASDITACEDTSKQERFSCFRAALERHGMHHDLREFIELVQTNAYTENNTRGGEYAIFGTNCHTLQHALGDFAADAMGERTIKEVLSYGNDLCAGGFYMGFFKRHAYEHDFATSTLENILNECPEIIKNVCAHELGHVLYDKYSEPVLGVIDQISKENYSLAVSDKNHTQKEASSLSQAFADCNNLLNETLATYCHTGVGHNMFLFAEFDPNGYLGKLDACASMPNQADQITCNEFLLFRIGINYAAPKFIAGDPNEGIVVCEKAIERSTPPDPELYRTHCYKGIGSGIGLFVESEYHDLARHPDNIELIRTILYDHADLCLAITDPNEFDCFAGLVGTEFFDYYVRFRGDHAELEAVLPFIDVTAVVS